MTFVRWIALALLATGLTGCRGGLVDAIACEQVRLLNVGMSPKMVDSILGEPVTTSKVSMPTRGIVVEYRGYDAAGVIFRGDSFGLMFHDGRLFSAQAFRHHPLSGSTLIFILERDPIDTAAPIDHREGREFESMFPCGSTPRSHPPVAASGL